MSSTMRSPEISRSPARVAGAGAGGRNLQSIGRQRSLVEDHPDNERIPARTVCAAFSLLVLGLLSFRGRIAAFSSSRRFDDGPGTTSMTCAGAEIMFDWFSFFQLLVYGRVSAKARWRQGGGGGDVPHLGEGGGEVAAMHCSPQVCGTVYAQTRYKQFDRACLGNGWGAGGEGCPESARVFDAAAPSL
ncbi:expressed unknown protein [Ectocarpus siliculosus]|uniref:Uncharacterized protein n=1 Tax=Ectocarpus siliculosus TaxID=2880 RepID=D7G3N7_ECTSI|nr:expressed unknown protein [Ectocarpus siliculosus]|eukprot:CBJ49290.1 expressed unknown protein [Ectocarpus siliculosus]